MHLRNAEIPLLHIEKSFFQEILWNPSPKCNQETTLVYVSQFRVEWGMVRRNRPSHSYRKRVFVMKNLEISFPAWNSMGKFWKYFFTLGFPNSVTPWPIVPIERPLERYSFLYVYPKNHLDCSISSTSYVMDNAHLCLGRRKTKQQNKTEFCKQNSTSRLIFESDL